MLQLFDKTYFNCTTSYSLETINTIDLGKIAHSFDNLPLDPYIKAKYRFRRLSSFKLANNDLIKLPHAPLFQSKKYNPLVGDVVRDYAELEQNLI